MQTTAASFIFYQIWMLGLSILGVVGESVPHLATVALAHALASAFGEETRCQAADFGTLLTVGTSEFVQRFTRPCSLPMFTSGSGGL